MRKRSEDTIKADMLAGDLLQHNVVDFWKNVRNLSNNKASNSTCIDAVVGEQCQWNVCPVRSFVIWRTFKEVDICFSRTNSVQ